MSKNDLYLGTEHGEVRVTTGETQLDRLEKKMDRILHLLGDKETVYFSDFNLTTSIKDIKNQ